MKLLRIAPLALSVGFVIVPACASALPKYVMQELIPAGMSLSYPAGLNDNGQIVGGSATNSAYGSPGAGFMTGANGQGITVLTGPQGELVRPGGINAIGQVVGTYDVSVWEVRSFITAPNGLGMTELSSVPGFNLFPTTVNDNGQVAGGYSPIQVYGSLSFVTGPNGVGFTSLDTPGNSSFAMGINASGQVVGTGQTPTQESFAYITDPGGTNARSVGSLGGGTTYGWGINKSGQVVGSSWTLNSEHAFMTGPNGTNMIDLGTQFTGISMAYRINDSAQVLGAYYDGPIATGNSHIFITDANGANATLLDSLILNNTDGTVLQASAFDAFLNNRGQIALAGLTPNGLRAILLTPVPVPGAIWLLGSTIGTLGFMRRHWA